MRVLPLMIVPLLAGCGVREANLRMFDNQTTPSAQHRRSIVEHARDTFFDPYSLRDAEISNVVTSGDIGGGPGTPMICIKVNGKNRLGGYTGRQAHLYYMSAGGTVLRTTDGDWGFCGNEQLRYTPFPELEQMRSISRS